LTFKDIMERSRRSKASNIVLALDQLPCEPHETITESLKILEKVHEHICALKLNYHLVLPFGLSNGVRRIVETAHNLDLPVIMDCKINDIGYTNSAIAENLFKAGFDAVTANPFIGWEEGIQPVFKVAREMNRGVILLVYMSHKASWEGYGQTVYDAETGKPRANYLLFAEKALRWGADGAVVGATYPEKIREVHAILGDKVPIYSPGVGVQGGDAKSAVSLGARYLIVGRAITLSNKPEEVALNIKDAAKY